jgi:hypothetical protein
MTARCSGKLDVQMTLHSEMTPCSTSAAYPSGHYGTHAKGVAAPIEAVPQLGVIDGLVSVTQRQWRLPPIEAGSRQ